MEADAVAQKLRFQNGPHDGDHPIKDQDSGAQGPLTGEKEIKPPGDQDAAAAQDGKNVHRSHQQPHHRKILHPQQPQPHRHFSEGQEHQQKIGFHYPAPGVHQIDFGF